MNSKVGLALSVVGIASVLMLILAPITANQTFGYAYRYKGAYGHHGYGYKYGYKYGYGHRGYGYKYGYHGHGHGCVVKVVRGYHGVYKKKVCYRR
jgi:hypothetical protein